MIQGWRRTGEIKKNRNCTGMEKDMRDGKTLNDTGMENGRKEGGTERTRNDTDMEWEWTDGNV
jgi:hypothetical protein